PSQNDPFLTGNALFSTENAPFSSENTSFVTKKHFVSGSEQGVLHRVSFKTNRVYFWLKYEIPAGDEGSFGPIPTAVIP
ncbi:MAG: hypothetical protein LBG57_11600, partial [Treponema sp.]|nr:hypothetical protein [Treponema sp.]